jgi:hypothetical protein
VAEQRRHERPNGISVHFFALCTWTLLFTSRMETAFILRRVVFDWRSMQRLRSREWRTKSHEDKKKENESGRVDRSSATGKQMSKTIQP